jgi:hypothetical protein
MKITKTQLKQIIKEEISKVLSENDKCQAVREEWEKRIPELYGGQAGDYDWEGEEMELTDWMKGYPECFKNELAKLDPKTGYFPKNDNPIIDFLASTSTNKGPMTHAQRMAGHQRKIQDY